MGGIQVRVFAAALEWAIFLVLLPFLMLHPRVRQGVRRRLGLYDGDPVRAPGPRVWLHGASAGDVLGLVPIVRELKALRPDARVLVSAITDSGASMAEQRLIASGLAAARSQRCGRTCSSSSTPSSGPSSSAPPRARASGWR